MKMQSILAAVAVACLISCATGQPAGVRPVRPAPENGAALYRIGIGDVLEIMTWKEPDFSREVFVRTDGMISFPLLDDIPAAGRTTLEVRDEIEEKLKEYISYPIVSVSVKVPNSQKFYISGQVLKPGEYPIMKQLTVVQALALAGGFTDWANKNDIILITKDGGEEHVIRIDYSAIEEGEGLDQNVIIKADDIIVVP